MLAKYEACEEEPVPFKGPCVEMIYSACGGNDRSRCPREERGNTVYLLCEGEFEGGELDWSIPIGRRI